MSPKLNGLDDQIQFVGRNGFYIGLSYGIIQAYVFGQYPVEDFVMVMLTTSSHTRTEDLAYLAGCIAENNCCAIVGVSNIGKSSLLRQIRQPQILSELSNLDTNKLAFFLIDFNLQLQMTQQGFYELILRTALNELRSMQADQALISQVKQAYDQIVLPTDDFQNALSFNEAIIALCEKWDRRLVFLFDEFDEVYQGIDKRVFLNLRALRDKYANRLMYIVVIGMPLSDSRHQAEDGEFAELFAHHTHHLKTLRRQDVAYIINLFAEDQGVVFSDNDIQLIFEESGGHPGLLQVVCQVMADSTVAEVVRDNRLVLNQLDDNDNIRDECVKLWNDLAPERQKALMAFVADGEIEPELQQSLLRKGIFSKDENGTVKIFGNLFEDFIRRFQLVYEEPKKGVLIDIESGEVYVDGQAIEALTSLEYRLLLLLYGSLDKICDKYRIVEAVWGEDYIEEVDDARIEKLVSRLRQKLEPSPSDPKYLLTVRGRGYRLQSK